MDFTDESQHTVLTPEIQSILRRGGPDMGRRLGLAMALGTPRSTTMRRRYPEALGAVRLPPFRSKPRG